jgi:hypothetical protein
LLACKSRQCQGDTSLMLLATSTIKGNLTAWPCHNSDDPLYSFS